MRNVKNIAFRLKINALKFGHVRKKLYLCSVKRKQEMTEAEAKILVEKVRTLKEENNDLKAQIAYLKRQLYGRKSEKCQPFDPSQPNFMQDLFPDWTPEDIEEPSKKAAEKICKEEKVANRRQERRNRSMIENLPVLERRVIEPEGIDYDRYVKIGEEVTKMVEHQPGKLYVVEIVRPKYGLKDTTEAVEQGKGVMIAPMPLLPIYKGIAGASLLAEILLQKYEYHMPFYRQIKQFQQLGMQGLTETTVDGWFKKSMELLRPLYNALVEETMRSDYLQVDETTTPVINKERHVAAKEYLWMARAVMEKLVCFHYDNGSRAGRVIENLVKRGNFKGTLQCDGFKGYETAFKANPDVTLVNCMAHIRRHFEQALTENKEPAEYAMGEIQKLYRIERICEDGQLSPEEIKAKRQELAKPIMDSMEKWMENMASKYSESSLIGKAVTYAYTRWDNMRHYLDDGRIKIDNNLAENEIRPITLGRKNYLFCGNHEAAENMCVVISLLSSCRNHNINPRDYLNDVIARMPYMAKATHKELVELLPHKWKSKTIETAVEE